MPMTATQSEMAHDSKDAQRSARSAACWNCGQHGHFSRNCPQPRSEQRSRSSYPTNQHGGSETENLQIAGTSTESRRSDTHCVYLKARVGSHDCDCLLDTGSEASLIPARMVRASLIQQTSQSLKAANGTPIAVLGVATIPMRVGNLRTSVSGLVSDHIAEVMLGIDWLTTNNAVWNFAQTKIWLNGEQHNLHSRRNSNTWIRRVYLQEDVEIPPRAEKDLYTKVLIRGKLTELGGTEWSTEMFQPMPGVRIARTLIPTDKFADVPVRAMNLLSESAHLKAGTMIAELQPVSVVQCDEKDKHVKIVVNDTTDAPSGDVEDFLPDYLQCLVDEVHDSIKEGTVIELTDLLKRYADVFSKSDQDLGLTSLVKHAIVTGSARPFRQQLRRCPPAHVEAISKHVSDMLRQGVIEPATSPWASNIVLVKKKDNTFRCCVDYRRLNQVTRGDAYPLPRIDSCLDAMSGARWFSTFDLRSSYHQVPVEPEDRDKTAFICPRGMYRFKTMPFGLVNAGATFQRLMDNVLTGLHLDICLVYLDDIVVF